MFVYTFCVTIVCLTLAQRSSAAERIVNRTSTVPDKPVRTPSKDDIAWIDAVRAHLSGSQNTSAGRINWTALYPALRSNSPNASQLWTAAKSAKKPLSIEQLMSSNGQMSPAESSELMELAAEAENEAANGEPNFVAAYSPTMLTFAKILYGTVCIVGLSGNTLVIYVVLRFSKMQTVTNMYILNLALADEMFLIGLPFLIATLTYRYWAFGWFVCKVYMTITSINQFTSSLLLTVMSADRYMHVNPFTSKIECFIINKCFAIVQQLHRRVSSDFVASLPNAFHCQSDLFVRLGAVRLPHDSHIHFCR